MSSSNKTKKKINSTTKKTKKPILHKQTENQFISSIRDVKTELIKKHNKNKKDTKTNKEHESELKSLERKLKSRDKILDERSKKLTNKKRSIKKKRNQSKKTCYETTKLRR